MTRTAGSWLVAALFILCGSAYGDTFDMSWTGGFGPGSATLTANPIGGGVFLVTAMTGTQNGSAVSLLPPGTVGGNDNEIFPSARLLDSNGLSFTAGGTSFNVFDAVPGAATPVFDECDASTGGCLAINTLTITPATSAVPEPVSIALVGTMALALIGIRRRRSSRA